MCPRRPFLIPILAALLAGCVLPDVRAPQDDPVAAGPEGLRGPLLRVDVVDVGQGDAILVRSPAGKTLLFDAGPRVRAPELVQHLRDAGVTRIDVLVLSHAHEDHYGGVLQIAEDLPIGQAYEPGYATNRAPWRATMHALESRHVPVLNAWNFTPGDRIPLGDETINLMILSPLGINPEKELADQGIVLRLEYGAFSMLLPGDIGTSTEQQLTDAGLGRTTVVLAPHHGSAYSSSDRLVRATQPELVVISSGAGNDYGHPSTETIAKWRRTGASVLRTDEAGTIRLLTDGDHWQVLPAS